MYIDPGIGSIAVQFLIGILVAVPMTIGIFWRRIKRVVLRSRELPRP